jgi:hypothetical protein
MKMEKSMSEEQLLDIPDDALSEIAETAPSLSEQERRYVYWRMVGSPPLDAFKKASYTGTNWRVVDTRPRVRNAIADMHERIEPDWRVTQKTVVGILFEAVDIARRKDQAGNLIEAATALANITGVAAASKMQIQQDTRISIEHRQEVQALKHMPRTQLEQLVGVNRMLPQTIDAEYEEVYVNE